MASLNPFGLLHDDDSGDTLQALPAEKKSAAKKQPKPASSVHPEPAKLPSKPLPPAQAVREARSGGQNQSVRGGRGGGGGGGISSRDYNEGYQGGRGRFYEGNEENFGGLQYGEGRGRGGRGAGWRGAGWRGGRGGRVANDDADRPRRREYERRSGTGRGNEMKREGSGQGNWGIATDLVAFQEIEQPGFAEEKNSALEKQPDQGTLAANSLEKNQEEEDKEMTLDEYEKVLEDRRKALQAKKVEERKVDFDKEFESMKQLTDRKHEEDVFIKLGSEKDKDRRNDIVGRVKRVTTPVSINAFLKPAEGERYYAPGGRGRGRGRNDRGGFRVGFPGGTAPEPEHVAPQIEDPGQFPTLGGK